jgi:DNA-binding SARP family transcriptional activator
MPTAVVLSRYRVLGPVRITGTPAAPCPPKARALLALLVLNANRPVRYAEIARELWADDPPPSARANVRTYAAGLRQAGARVTATGDGYWLATDPHDIDLVRFRAAAARGRALREAGDRAGAAEAFRAAAAMWRGQALDGIPVGTLLRPWKAALDQERVALAEDLAALHATRRPNAPAAPFARHHRAAGLTTAAG